MFDDYSAAKHRLETATIAKQDYMKTTQPSDQAFFLQRAQHLFDRLGNPERGIKTLHIAGTSGKGSTSTMLYNVLRESGKRVGLYTSPYVQTPIENISVNGRLMDPAAFIRLVNSTLLIVEQIAAEDPAMKPSYAEVFFSIAVQYMHECDVEYVVLETGCGGRFDYSNITMNVVASVITPIGIDHTDILGDTIEQIAWHKAGIIKKQIPVFTNNTKPIIQNIIAAEANTQDAPLHIVKSASAQPYTTGMAGAHQQQNAELVAAVCHFLHIPDEAIARGIATTKLPARMEILQQSPLVILDGAHSEPKLRAMQSSLHELTDTEPIIILSLKETKDLSATLAIILEVSTTIICTSWELPGFSSYPPETVAAELQKQSPTADLYTEPDAMQAIEAGLALAAQTNRPLLITGSLYLAGSIREYWIKTDDILTQRTLFPNQMTPSTI